MNITLARFGEKDTSGWNDFLSSAKNEIFLFHRSYMSYHADRFADHSLLIYRANKLVALFPANEKEHTVYSHAGLTFGGLIMGTELKVHDTVELMQAIM
ncbi:MAG: GNAT family N-acetyltransferase, partial [Chitinophagaceae bacterium]